jgi:2'-5' RNA ligase
VIRAFLAIELSKEILDRYAASLLGWRAQQRELRWVRPENLHMTLRFLGDTSEDRLDPLRRRVEEGIRTVRPFAAVLDEAGCFGPDAAPQVLWLGIGAGAAELVELSASVEAAVRSLGFAKEDKPWRPHITIARNPRKARWDGWRVALEEAGLASLAFPVREVTLFSSVLGPKGPTYARVWQAPIKDDHESK